jgi:hypothetical protein
MDTWLWVPKVFEREGVHLDKKNEKNPGRRACAKVMLNSLWGKYCQRANWLQSQMVSDPTNFFSIMFDEKLKDQYPVFLNGGSLVEVRYRTKEEHVQVNPKTNVAIGIWTTMLARLKLYEALEKLDQQVLYYDTDSVIFEYDPHTCLGLPVFGPSR